AAHYFPPLPTRRSSDLHDPLPEGPRGRGMHSAVTSLVQLLACDTLSPPKSNPVEHRRSARPLRNGRSVEDLSPATNISGIWPKRSEEHTSELQSRVDLV